MSNVSNFTVWTNGDKLLLLPVRCQKNEFDDDYCYKKLFMWIIIRTPAPALFLPDIQFCHFHVCLCNSFGHNFKYNIVLMCVSLSPSLQTGYYFDCDYCCYWNMFSSPSHRTLSIPWSNSISVCLLVNCCQWLLYTLGLCTLFSWCVCVRFCCSCRVVFFICTNRMNSYVHNDDEVKS